MPRTKCLWQLILLPADATTAGENGGMTHWVCWRRPERREKCLKKTYSRDSIMSYLQSGARDEIYLHIKERRHCRSRNLAVSILQSSSWVQGRSRGILNICTPLFVLPCLGPWGKGLWGIQIGPFGIKGSHFWKIYFPLAKLHFPFSESSEIGAA